MPSWPPGTYGHVHEKQGELRPHDVSRKAVAFQLSSASGRLELGVSAEAFLGGCVGSRGSQRTWRCWRPDLEMATPDGRFAGANSAGGAAVSAQAAGVLYVPAYMKRVKTGGSGAPGGPTCPCKTPGWRCHWTQASPGVRRPAPSLRPRPPLPTYFRRPATRRIWWHIAV